MQIHFCRVVCGHSTVNNTLLLNSLLLSTGSIMSRWGPTPSPPPLPSSVSPSPGNPPLYAPQPQRSVPIPQPNGLAGSTANHPGGPNPPYSNSMYSHGQSGKFTQSGNVGAYGQPSQGGFYDSNMGHQNQMHYNSAKSSSQPAQQGWNGAPVAGQPPVGMGNFFPSQFVQDLTAGNPAAQLGVDFAARMIAERSEFVNQNVQPYLNISSLKYYFAVSNKYVIDKLGLLVAPWRHTSWSRHVRRTQQGAPDGYRVPREDVNAPDLYIPAMAFVTYVLLVGISLGQQEKFHPSQLGSTSTTALALLALEVLLFRLGVYLLNVNMEGSIWDMVAVGGYKFVGIILTMLIRMTPLRSYTLVWLGLFAYVMVAYAFFLLRTLKYTVLPEQFSAHAPTAAASTAHLPPSVKQRRVYFLFVMAGVGVVVSGILIRIV
ncbi:YIF1-domain-containing protein [Gonapodya prolifera JEL478]|uniref:YIF1-domain-containing protein n=1 Tax=Gonapodya prolifera (strain JEL478) TaxID=1344416 RepID=A0A138ZZR6_GONPJ|nr:YIF1-domain-containing protein [Gonapodya prolifera JEL478]|eukprot:KXS10006.1 YIF1-domain-containing protein [Gonapodya prolifera JEL478]